jgi:hypothetical protein
MVWRAVRPGRVAYRRTDERLLQHSGGVVWLADRRAVESDHHAVHDAGSTRQFTHSQGWAAGVDATVAVLQVGANGNVDTSTATSPVEAFVLTNAGLMAGVSLEGTKISRLII